MASELIQIYYREEQKTALYPFARPYFNERLTIFFENEVIRALVPESKADKIAVCSWKLAEKMKYYIGRPRPITQELLDSEYEVISFTRNTQYHDFFAFADAHHKNFRKNFEKLLASVGIKMPYKVKSPIYQNHFTSKREIYQDYVKNYLIPCMESIKNDPEINKIAMEDSKYSQLAKSSAASPEYLQEKIGVPFYPMAPFLLERLFSVYCTNNKINVTWL